MKTRLAKYFTLGELIKHREDNKPTLEHLINLTILSNKILDPVRIHFGVTTITSGYRNEAYNRSVGGKATSQHITGQAVDFIVNTDLKEVFNFIVNYLEYDQVILENDKGKQWIHVSYNVLQNRKQALTYTNGVYKPYKI